MGRRHHAHVDILLVGCLDLLLLLLQQLDLLLDGQLFHCGARDGLVSKTHEREGRGRSRQRLA